MNADQRRLGWRPPADMNTELGSATLAGDGSEDRRFQNEEVIGVHRRSPAAFDCLFSGLPEPRR